MTAEPLQEALIVAERLSRTDQLRLITTLLQRMQASAEEEEPIDLLTLAGVGAEVWSQIDVEAYLDQERDSWQN